MTSSLIVEADVVVAAGRLAGSDRLRRRRFQMVPVELPTVEVQGREPGDSTTPAELVELISSIATVGLLSPLLLEDVPDVGLRVVAGERRLRALRWGRVNHPENPNFVEAPAVVCPGPLSEEERRVWQLVENLARTDLGPGELAAALMFERSAVLMSLLHDAGHHIPEHVLDAEDPVVRWELLNRFRVDVDEHHLGAPWEMVIKRLGLQLTEARAEQLARALRALPADLSADMDAHGVHLASRLEFVRLHRGRADAAAGIWEALKARGEPRLLTAAVQLAIGGSDDPVGDAQTRRDLANAARSAALRPDPDPAGIDDDAPVEVLPLEVLEAAFEALDALLERLRTGQRLAGYQTGSLRLRLRELDERTAA